MKCNIWLTGLGGSYVHIHCATAKFFVYSLVLHNILVNKHNILLFINICKYIWLYERGVVHMTEYYI